jgi:hypothetical protein
MKFIKIFSLLVLFVFLSSCSNVSYLKEFPYIGPRISMGMHRSEVERILTGGPSQVSYSYDNYEINSFMGVNTNKVISRGFGKDYRIILDGGVNGRAFFTDGVASFIDKNGRIYSGSGKYGTKNYIITIYYDSKYLVRDIKFKEIYRPNESGKFLNF